MATPSSDAHAAPRGHRKKDRHAYHNLNQNDAATPTTSGQYGQEPLASPSHAAQWNQSPPAGQAQQLARPTTPLTGAPASSAQGRVDPEQIPSIAWSRDAPAQFYLDHMYPTIEQHLPPPSTVPFVAVDQGNASPKFARLSLNNIPSSAEALNSTAIPLGLVIQPLASRQEGEQEVPVVDFGDVGPPRCRRCRTYINPFMTFRSGGNKLVCNMCTFPNDVSPEYFAPTDPSGARIDRNQRPELMLGTIEFVAPKEYWTIQPVRQHHLFLIDVSMEACSKGFLEAFCQGILAALYGDDLETNEKNNEDENDEEPKGTVPSPNALIGIATYDKETHFFNLNPKLEKAQMVVMSDIEDPFVPFTEGLFVDAVAAKKNIVELLQRIPEMFLRVKNPEPALSPAMNAALDALKTTGGRITCSLSAMPTWGPGRLYLRDRPELRDTDGERQLFKTENPAFTGAANKATELGIGVDFFLAAPQGAYLDLAAITHISSQTGGEAYYYPAFNHPRDSLTVANSLKRLVAREQGFQALLKVRCSNGLQVADYTGAFKQHTFGADLEFGAIDADKAFAVSFTYDGKLDPKLDAHFQSALLYTTATGQRRIRCSNVVASVSDGATESMKLVDQDAVVAILAKQAAASLPERMLRDIRARIIERTIDILSSYRKNFSGSHPPGQLVLPEHLKELAMYMLGLIKSRALKPGVEPNDRRVYDSRSILSMSSREIALALYPRIIGLHNLAETDGFPNEHGHLVMPSGVRASYGRIDEGGAYLVDYATGPVILWLHAQVSPNLLEDLFGPGCDALANLDPLLNDIPVLETHLNAQVRNVVQWLADCRGSKGISVQLARQGLDGAEFEFARALVEDRQGEVQSYVDWLVHVHRGVQLELQGQRVKGDGADGSAGGGALASLSSLRTSLFS